MFDICDAEYERCNCCSEVIDEVYVIADLGMFCSLCYKEIVEKA